MAPEMLLKDNYLKSTDIYALGVTIFNLMAFK